MSTTYHAAAIRWCPNCDLPLRRRVNRVSGTLSWRTTLGQPIDRCPRCIAWLPVTRPLLEVVVEQTNEILVEMGEPPTCAEELERAVTDPWGEAA